VTGVLDHACITVPDLEAARRFYDAVFGALGIPCVGADEAWIGYGLRADGAHPGRSYVSIRKGAPAGPGFVWAFRAPDAAALAAFEAAGLAAGGHFAAADRPPVGQQWSSVLSDPAGHRVAAVLEP
jgi:catechol 2,3-dioxygenase-like lactoylglutathione lyase family enzyme